MVNDGWNMDDLRSDLKFKAPETEPGFQVLWEKAASERHSC